MNNEKYNQIINEAYESYTRYPLATIHDHRTNILYQNMHKGWCMLNGRSMASPHPTRHLTKEEFIKKCKTDAEFSEKWGLKIEERELSGDERFRIAYKNLELRKKLELESMNLHYPNGHNKVMDDANVPTKLITVTYNDIKTEIYES